MANSYFKFKQFTVFQEGSAFKVGTDGVILGAAADVFRAGSILDIGTGSGLIALMLAQRCEAQITAIEPDRDSFEQALENVSLSPWKERINVVNVSLQDFSGRTRFDLIVSNPPYFIDSLRNPDLSKSNARHNKMLTHAEILEGTDRLLANGGRLQVIMPYAEGNIFIAAAANYGLYCYDMLKIKPLPTSEVRRLILSFGREKKKPAEKFLVIEKGKRHDFTGDYINLTKDFYLKF